MSSLTLIPGGKGDWYERIIMPNTDPRVAHFLPSGNIVTCPHCGEPIDEAALKWLEEPLPTL